MASPDYVTPRKRFLLDREFWADALERAVRAAAGAAMLVLGAGEAGLILGADWRLSLSVAAGAAVCSILVSVAAGAVTDPGTAGFLTRAP